MRCTRSQKRRTRQDGKTKNHFIGRYHAPTKKAKTANEIKQERRAKEMAPLIAKEPITLNLLQRTSLSFWLSESSTFGLRKISSTIGIKRKLTFKRKNDSNSTRSSSEVSDDSSHMTSIMNVKTRAASSKKVKTSGKVKVKNEEMSKDNQKKYDKERAKHSKGAPIKITGILRNAKRISSNEDEILLNAEKTVRLMIAADEHLREHYKRTFEEKIDKGVMQTMAKIVSKHIEESLKPKGSDKEIVAVKREFKDIQFDDILMDFIKNAKYTPPKSRILIGKKKSERSQTITAVYSDISKETAGTVSLSEDFIYKYTNQNVVDPSKFPNLVSFTKEAENPINIIKCGCCEPGSIKKCWQNPLCACYKMNMKLKKLQENKKPIHGATNFSTFDPVLVRDENHFFDTIGFACSEECGCKGKCTNNVTLLPEKEINQLEIYRKDANMGFGVRTLNAIPAGTPVMEFTGDLIDEDLMDTKDEDYAYAIINENDLILSTECSKFNSMWDKNFKKRMKEQLDIHWYINPKRIGNIARTCCHSCEPNLALVKVFQKGFSPAHCRLLLVTQEVVFPGVELTIDYGPVYIRSLGNCLCKKAGCKSSKAFEILRNASSKSLEEYHALRYHFEYRRFKKTVLDRLSDQKVLRNYPRITQL